MLKPTARIITLLAGLAVAGCSTARKSDVLEARLRSQEDMLATYESEMKRVKNELSVARRESETLRLQMAEDGQSLPAEETQAIARVEGIQFSTLMTGGADIDASPGHDGLSVVLIPHDHDGELVKLPGSIEIEAFDLSQPGGAQRIGHWTFDQRDAHEYWHKGVIQSGYQFELPWQSPPHSDQVLVHGHLRTADGRKFDTTLTVKVDPPTGDAPVPMVEGVQQASAEQANPFTRQQDAETGSVSLAPDNNVIWADGEQQQQQRARPTSSATPWPQPPASKPKAVSAREASLREVPPPIEDWWDSDEWSTDNAPTADGTRTSDSFTDESIPRYR